LRIHIRDDGKGIDSEILAKGGVSGHWGMSGMRERSHKLGARLLVRSGAGSGTDVELDIPAAVAYRDRSAGPHWWNALLSRKTAGGNHDE
jgi:nitrate/nitrite-specific signal transduction histidine kinase